MSESLRELLFAMRQHPAFPEMIEHVARMNPANVEYKNSRSEDVAKQQAEWIFRSGRRAQHSLLQSFLTDYDPRSGSTHSQQEIP